MIQKSNFLKSATGRIILANVVVFIIFGIASWFVNLNTLLSLFALQPASIIKGQKLWTLITSMFLHIQFWHIFVNMFSLYFVGSFVEQILGKRRMYLVYFLSGILAGIFWSVISGFLSVTPILSRIIGDPLIFGVGASGAIFGLVGVLAVITPRAKVFLIAGPIIAMLVETLVFGIFDKAGLSNVMPYSAMLSVFEIVVLVYFVFAIFSMISFNPRKRNISLPIQLEMWILPIVAIIPLIILSIFIDFPIGNIAHLGGLIAGLIYGYYIKSKYPKKSKIIGNMFR